MHHRIDQLMLRLYAAFLRPRQRDERGDVPGWVLVTVMTAGLVGALWHFAGPQLQNMLATALDQVTG